MTPSQCQVDATVKPQASRRKFLRRLGIGVGLVTPLLGLDGSPASASTGPTQSDGPLQQPNDHVVYHPATADAAMTGFPPQGRRLVTIDNYRFDPGDFKTVGNARTRWAHLHMREIFPTQPIGRGNKPVRVLPARQAGLGDISVPDGTGGKVSRSVWLPATFTDALLVIHNGVIVHEEYFHGMKEDSLHQLWSLSRTISAGVVATLMARGEIREHALITDYVPELKSTAYQGATVRQLLDMRSGVLWDYDSPAEKATWPRWERAAGLARKLPDEPTECGMYHFLANDRDMKVQTRPHGACFYYKDSDTMALVWACERVTGTRFADLLSEVVWSGIGAEQDALITCDGVGTAMAAGAISVTLRDLGRWGLAHLDAILDRGHSVLPSPFVKDLAKNAKPPAAESFPGPRQGLPEYMTYRSHYWVNQSLSDKKEPILSPGGVYGQTCTIFPKRNMVFAKLSTYDFSSFPEYFQLERRDFLCFRAIADALSNATG